MVHTRPDIAFSIQYLSQFNQKPSQFHYDAALHVLRYLKGTLNKGLFFIMFGDNPISWKSKKQVTISLSSAEAEYRSMCRVCAELAWLSRLLSELQVEGVTPIPLKCDNQVAIYIATNPVFHERTKHIELGYHYVHEKLQARIISLHHVPTNDQLADVLTKSLSGIRHQDVISKLGLLPYPPA